MKPFGPDSLTGVELELLAPKGRSRRDLAQALADLWQGGLRYGLKYSSEGLVADGRAVCTLTPAFTVVDQTGRDRVTIVDDTTIRFDLDGDQPTPAGWYRVVMDDVRLALLAERVSHAQTLEPQAVLAPLIELFGGYIGAPGDQTSSVEHRRITDAYDQPLAVIAPLPGERDRVAEVVTVPLRREERSEVLTQIIQTANELEFAVPTEAALHLHFDAAPWQSTAALGALLRRTESDRDELRQRFAVNPRCRGVGPQPTDVQRVLSQAKDDLPFATFAAAIAIAGASRYCDVNILGVVERHPRHPTVEYRALSMTLEAGVLLAKLQELEAYLDGVWASAQRQV